MAPLLGRALLARGADAAELRRALTTMGFKVDIAAARDVLVPPPGDATPMKIEPIYKGSAFFGTFSLKPPVEDRPTGVHFEGILSSLGVSNTLRVLGALMTEQHVVFVGARWGHVSGCVHAATSMLYPLQWQHILIPVHNHYHCRNHHIPLVFLTTKYLSNYAI